MVMDYIAMLIGYTMMATGAVTMLGYGVCFAAYVGNKAHWAIVDHIGGYRMLIEFKKWRDQQEATRQEGAE